MWSGTTRLPPASNGRPGCSPPSSANLMSESLSDPLPEAAAAETALAPEVKIPKELWIDELNAAPFHELLDRQRFMPVERIPNNDGIPADEWKETTEFEKLTAMHPNERIVLENPRSRSITTRAIDLISPLGRGQRGLIVAPPRTGKTVMLK